MFFGGSMGGGNQSRRFESQYHVHSTGYAGKEVYNGDKIFLPPSALDRLARMNIEYPMLFEVTNEFAGRRTHCGVLEFSAEEGFCYMPYWMMDNLSLEEGQLITVKNVSLPKATFVKFRAQSVDFLEVANPRALLEVALRAFTCLTEGDVVQIPHGGKKFHLEVREVKPNGAASIIETDCNVDFEEPLGYKESKYAEYERKKAEENEAKAVPLAPRVLQKAKEEDETASDKNSFKAFSGAAKRIDGKLPPAAQQTKNGEEKDSKDSKSTPSASATATASNSTSNTPKPATIAYESKIGDKYSKKKAAVSAFGGTAHKLSG